MNQKNYKVYKEERISQKNGSSYVCLVIEYKNYKKIVFFNNVAEKMIFEDFIGDLHEK